MKHKSSREKTPASPTAEKESSARAASLSEKEQHPKPQSNGRAARFEREDRPPRPPSRTSRAGARKSKDRGHSIDKEELKKRLTEEDRLKLFRELGFRVECQEPDTDGYINGIKGPPELGEREKGNFSINVRTGAVKDFGSTNYTGDLYKAVQDVVGLSFPEALHWIAERIGADAAKLSGGDAAKWDPFTDGKKVATYSYVDEEGATAFEVVRFEVKAGHPVHPDKTFLQRSPEGEWGRQGAQPILYRLPEVLSSAEAGEIVLVCEGEKDVETLRELGFTATCNPGGAGKWKNRYSEDLAGARVVVIPDNDEAGERHAQEVARSCQGKAASVRIVQLPDLPPKGDVTDWIESGHGPGDLEREIEKAPLYEPAQAAQQSPSEETSSIKAKIRSGDAIIADSAEPDFLAYPYLVRGALHEFVGKQKASGKTTWLLKLAEAGLRRKQFLGEPVESSGVLYLTEQPEASFRQALQSTGLLTEEGELPQDFHVLYYFDVADSSWPEIAHEAADFCREKGLDLLIVDTLHQWAEIEGDGENSSGTALEAVRPLQKAAHQTELAVVAARHERKGGGSIVDSGRGSSAFSGAVDIILRLKRPEGNTRPTVRELEAIGRFDLPESLMIELTDTEYKLLGTEADVQRQTCREFIIEHVPQVPTDLDEDVAEEHGVKVKGLENKIEEQSFSPSLLQEQLKALAEKGRIQRTRLSTRGRPYVYWQ